MNNLIKEMNTKEAIKAMSKGNFITRQGFLPDDYLFMEDGIIKDDGGNEHNIHYYPNSGWKIKSKLKYTKKNNKEVNHENILQKEFTY